MVEIEKKHLKIRNSACAQLSNVSTELCTYMTHEQFQFYSIKRLGNIRDLRQVIEEKMFLKVHMR